jgi:hypothetical protein
MTRDKGIIGIFRQRGIFKGFGSLGSQTASLGSLGGHLEKV